MSETRTCSWCGMEGITGGCPHCTRWIKHAPKRHEMTPEERMAEVRDHTKLEVPFTAWHLRMQEVIGRPVLVHEFNTDNLENLILEAGDKRDVPADPLNLAALPPDIEVVLIPEMWPYRRVNYTPDDLELGENHE